MRSTIILLVTIALATSCKKTEIPPAPKVQVQTEYRLIKAYTDLATQTTYSYNDDNLVSSIMSYYYGQDPQSKLRDTVLSHSFYEYDNQWRVTKFAGTPLADAKEYFSYTYNDYFKPSALYNSKYSNPSEEYRYNEDGKITERKVYNPTSRAISYTQQWTYNSAGNLEQVKIQTLHDGITMTDVTNYREYDNARAIRYAMPGIQDIQFTGGLSENNVLRYDHTMSDSDGNYYTDSTVNTYEYNSANFPIKRTTTTVIDCVTIHSSPVYYDYK